MNYFLWLFPALIVVGLLSSGRVGLSLASTAGTVAALVAALISAPHTYQIGHAITSIERGAWIGLIVVPYILGGLLFWRLALREDYCSPASNVAQTARSRRRSLFFACFLVGPFAESATGFGAGIFGALAIIRRLGFSAGPLRTFSLLSQTQILWGAMASGVIVGGAYASTDPTTLALNCVPFFVVLQIMWLPLFWRLAARSGAPAKRGELLNEALWLGIALASIIGCTYTLGPEVAMLAAYGPLIALRWYIDHRPDREQARSAVRRMMPFGILIGGLIASRVFAPFSTFLQTEGRLQPFSDAPAWSPLFHAGSWLFLGGIGIAVLRRNFRALRDEMIASWRIGSVAVLGVIQFSIMAEILSGSGIAGAIADGVFVAAGRWALLASPFISGTFGLLTNGSNAPNGLFMASQISLARLAELNVPAVVALQQFSVSMMSMFSPVRIAIICGLAATPGQERAAYRAVIPHMIWLAVLLGVSALLICLRIV